MDPVRINDHSLSTNEDKKEGDILGSWLSENRACWVISVNMTQSCIDGESQDESIRTAQSMMFFHYCSLSPHVFTFMYFSCSFLAFLGWY